MKKNLKIIAVALFMVALGGYLGTVLLYDNLLEHKAALMSQYGLNENQDEKLHRVLSKHVMLELYERTGNLWLSEKITFSLGWLKEYYDVLDGKHIDSRDLEADSLGIEDARKEISQRD